MNKDKVTELETIENNIEVSNQENVILEENKDVEVSNLKIEEIEEAEIEEAEIDNDLDLKLNDVDTIPVKEKKNKKTIIVMVVLFIIAIVVGAICFVVSTEAKDNEAIINTINSDITEWETTEDLFHFITNCIYDTSLFETEEDLSTANNIVKNITDKVLEKAEHKEITKTNITKENNEAIVTVEFTALSYPEYISILMNTYNEVYFDTIIPAQIDSTVDINKLIEEADIKLNNALVSTIEEINKFDNVTITYTLIRQEDHSWLITNKTSSLPITDDFIKTNVLSQKEDADFVYISAYFSDFDYTLNPEFEEKNIEQWDQHIYDYVLQKFDVDLFEFMNEEHDH